MRRLGQASAFRLRGVMEARNGKEALEALRNFVPSVLLLDYRMPVMEVLKATTRPGTSS